MIKTNYYYLVAGLPEIILDKSQELTGLKFKQELESQLNKADYDLAELLFLEYNNQHLLNMYLGETNSEQNKETLSVEKIPYMQDFVDWSDKQKEPYIRLEFENKLNTLFFNHLLKCKNDFLKEWFLFKLNLKNILATINCVKYNFPIEKHLIKVNENRELTDLLLRKELEPRNFEDLLPKSKEIFSVINSNNTVLDTELKLDKIIWDYLDDETCYNYFSIEKILAFIIKLMLVERWNKLDEEKGQEMIDKLVADVREAHNESAKILT